MPKGFRETSRQQYECGQCIVIGWYETEDGVDEKCMLEYINNVLVNVILGER